MHRLFVVFFLVNLTAHGMQLHSFADMNEFFSFLEKQNFSNFGDGDANTIYSLNINSQADLEKFYCLPPATVPAMYKISIYVHDATETDLNAFKKFFQAHKSSFSRLQVFISSGLKLEDDFAELLCQNITGLAQVDLIDAGLTNYGLDCLLLEKNLLHINVANNVLIDDLICEIPSRAGLTLCLQGTSLIPDKSLKDKFNKENILVFHL